MESIYRPPMRYYTDLPWDIIQTSHEMLYRPPMRYYTDLTIFKLLFKFFTAFDDFFLEKVLFYKNFEPKILEQIFQVFQFWTNSLSKPRLCVKVCIIYNQCKSSWHLFHLINVWRVFLFIQLHINISLTAILFVLRFTIHYHELYLYLPKSLRQII